MIAPQLAQPVAISYEVSTKLHRLYLLAAIALGLILSYFVRVPCKKLAHVPAARQAWYPGAQIPDPGVGVFQPRSDGGGHHATRPGDARRLPVIAGPSVWRYRGNQRALPAG
jgi:hypothetical protein